jgi:hypothetical protein
MEKTPTAEEFLNRNIDYVLGKDAKQDVEQSMIEFAKLHVEQALKAASISKSQCTSYTEDGLDYKENKLCKDSVLNSYPPENIK